MTASLRAVSLAVLVSLGAAAPLTAAAQAPLEHLHVTVPGDTLIGIGRQLLAEPRRWRAVARLNRIANPDRIPVGARLRIPVAWMRTEPRPATLLGRIGTVQVPASLDEGSEVVTGDDGHAVIRLVDGTVLRLRPRSRLGLTESRVVPDTPVTRARARLGSGRVEVDAALRTPDGWTAHGELHLHGLREAFHFASVKSLSHPGASTRCTAPEAVDDHPSTST